MGDPLRCFNCGQYAYHISRECPNEEQNWTRCPTCNNVAKTAVAHRIHCRNTTFRSVKIGYYEQPFIEFHNVRFIFNETSDILVQENTTTGLQHFLVTKWFTTSDNIRFKRVYSQVDQNRLILDMKFKPSVSIGSGRSNEKCLVSIMFAPNQVRFNHFQHITEDGVVTYSLARRPHVDIPENHDVVLDLVKPGKMVMFPIEWNKKWTANILMNDKALTIGSNYTRTQLQRNE